MAHTKAGGSTNLGRDSKSKRLGVKRFGGQTVKPGDILIRQRGTKVHPGENVKRGEDDTLYSAGTGVVQFSVRKVKSFTGKLVRRQYINVVAKA